jgi:glycosyltransferase involved in cell wall biosynthesis
MLTDKQKPQISIIMVTYNAAAAMEDTIKAVIKVKHKIQEFIIIDGASTDGTVEILEKYKQEITYWVSEPDKGIYDAMNKGWNYANLNNHILFLGAGDIILKLPEATNLKKDVVYFGDAILGNDKLFKGKVDFRSKIGNTIHHQSLLVPKVLYPKSPFDITYKVYADFDFNQRLIKSKATFVKTDDLESYILPDGFSQHYKTKEWFYIIKKNFGSFHAALGYLFYQYQQLKRK